MTEPLARGDLAQVGRRLARLACGRWIWRLVDACGLGTAAVAGSVVALLVADQLLELPAGLRLLGLVALLAVSAWSALRLLLRLWRRPSADDGALRIERLLGLTDNRLINCLCFARRSAVPPHEQDLHAVIAASAADALTVVPRGAFFERRLILFRCLGAMAALAILLVYLQAFPDHAANGWARLLHPLTDRPVLGSFVVSLEPETAIERYAGQQLVVRVGIRPIWDEGMPEPRLVLRQDSDEVEVDGPGAVPVPLVADGTGGWVGRVGTLRTDLALRAQAGDSRSALLRVRVRERPQLNGSCSIDAPAYTGETGPTSHLIGEAFTCLPGSRLQLDLTSDVPVDGLIWEQGEQREALSGAGRHWSLETWVMGGGVYRLLMPVPSAMRDGSDEEFVVVATAMLGLDNDQPPSADWDLTSRNRLELPGSTLELPVIASDDHGLAELRILVSDAADPGSERELKRWAFIGPPGRSGTVRERLQLHLAPMAFPPGRSHILTIEARDWCPPAGQVSRSEPVVLRVRGLDELHIAGDSAFTKGFAQLQQAIAAEERALGLTAAARKLLDEVDAEDGLASRTTALARAQSQVHEHIEAAIARFAQADGGLPYATDLRRLLAGDCGLVLSGLASLPQRPPQDWDAGLGAVRDRQERILQDLVDLVGAIANDRSQLRSIAGEQEEAQEVDRDDLLRDLADDLKRFGREQRQMLDKAKTLVDRGSADLSLEEEEIVGEMARHQEEWAKLFEERLADFGKLPDQDFADSSLLEEWNEVYQEMQLAADALYKKQIELAVPHEQAGLESAEEILHNIERWLAEAPDHVLWSMEEPEQPPDAPLADLPDELEDLIGELLDDQSEMETAVEDVSSSWMDSLDKGAGWGTSDGPISNMSARGVTGNVLPNQNEVGGRSGEGRSGRSHGQMVEATADGKGGRETPTRLTPSPFEQGSVADSDSSQTGGATGGGKQSGYAGEGLLGPTPPPQLRQRMQRLADQQAALRQRGNALVLELRRRGYPSGDLEAAVEAMAMLERSARNGDGGSIVRAQSGALDGLGSAQDAVVGETRVRRQRSRLGERERSLLVDHQREEVPAGMEELLQRYYQALAGMDVGGAAQ